MKTLILMRHGKSSHDVSKVTDHDRPLKPRGIANAATMGKLMQEEGINPSLILSSTAKRAKDTAQLACEHANIKAGIQYLPELYHAAPETYLRVVRHKAKDDACVLLVGHNPGMEDLVTLLTGEQKEFPTAAIAQISLPIKAWAELNPEVKGKLTGFWKPRDQNDD